MNLHHDPLMGFPIWPGQNWQLHLQYLIQPSHGFPVQVTMEAEKLGDAVANLGFPDGQWWSQVHVSP